MANPNERNDDVLFEQLNKKKKRRKRRVTITVLVLVALVLAGVFTAVSVLRARVQERFNNAQADVKSYAATVGRINTVVSGTGVLAAVDSEQVTVPAGVEIDEVLVDAGDTVQQGDPLASVTVSSVMTALADTQAKLDDLDKQIRDAKNDTVSTSLSSTIGGRVKMIYAQADDNVVDVMTEHGALALLSLDGCMVVTVEADLQDCTAVTVRTGGKDYPGTVETSTGETAAVTLTDDGPLFGDEAQILDGKGTVLASGKLEIHNPLAITGYAGTISRVNVKENQRTYNGTSLFTLKNTGYSANYDALLRSREDSQNTLNTLIEMLRTSAVAAPFDGTVTSVDYGKEETPMSAAAAYAQNGTAAAADTKLLTMAPDDQVCVTIGIDETDILSLELGQSAEITVSSLSEDVLQGEVTEVSRVGGSYSGVTQYSAVVTLDKIPNMLVGMTAEVDIQITGVDDVVLIPLDALHRTSNRSYVFTAYDEAAQQYGGIVDVVPGSSNSNFVEIISGLKAGDTVYYTEQSSFNFFSMMPMDRRTSGGNMPRPGMGG